MIIESAIRLAFAAGCLTAIPTLPTAHAQMGGTAPGSYWTSPGAYGYGPPPGVMPRKASMSRRRPPQPPPEPS
jgi:hypothetical protein